MRLHPVEAGAAKCFWLDHTDLTGSHVRHGLLNFSPLSLGLVRLVF